MALSMSLFSPFFLLDCRERMQNSIASEKVTGCDGEVFTGMSTDVRYIEMTGFFDAAIGRRDMEGELKRVFNTGFAGVLEYYHKTDKKLYTINCFLEKTPEVIFNNARVEFAINLKCLDPYWYGEEVTHTIPPYTLTFENMGDSKAGVEFELSGSASQPFVFNGAGDRVTFVNNITNQMLKITSLPDKSLVEMNGINAMRFLSNPDQRGFFLLDIGSNTVNYGASSGAAGLSVKLSYKPRYLGTF
jgi:hypothetical protein